MMRALWSASSGMRAQQFNVDMISNNLANVSTTGYKRQRAEFSDVLYVTTQRAYMLENEGKPVNKQIGHGVVLKATSKDFIQGNFEQTDSKLDFAIDGDAFFSVRAPDDTIYYSRDGAFKIGMTENGKMLTTANGYPVLDTTGSEIYLDFEIDMMSVSEFGEISYKDEEGINIPTGQQIALYRFENPQALEAIGDNYLLNNSATGNPIDDADYTERSVIRNGYLESSNVQVVDEMVKLITAQRAYELNSKAIQSADEMLQMANGLKR